MSAAGRNDLSLVSAVDRGHALSLVGLVRSWSVVRTPLPGIRVGRVRAGHGLGYAPSVVALLRAALLVAFTRVRRT